MTALTDLTMNQFATAYTALSGIATTAKSCNGKAKWVARLEALMAEKDLTPADVLDAAGIEPPAAAPVDDALDQDVTAAEAAFTTPAAEAEPGIVPAPEPEALADEQVAEPVPEPAEEEAPLDAAGILGDETLASECRAILVKVLTDVGLDAEHATAAAERAVKALPLPAATAPRSREGTKQETMIVMLRRPEGTTISELAQTLGWTENSVRGMISAALKKRMGLTVVSEKGSDGARTYRIPTAA